MFPFRDYVATDVFFATDVFLATDYSLMLIIICVHELTSFGSQISF